MTEAKSDTKIETEPEIKTEVKPESVSTEAAGVWALNRAEVKGMAPSTSLFFRAGKIEFHCDQISKVCAATAFGMPYVAVCSGIWTFVFYMNSADAARFALQAARDAGVEDVRNNL
jgi:hypothetical protein